MVKGEALNEGTMRIVRPGLGLAPKYYGSIIGRKVNKDKKRYGIDWTIIA